MTDPRKNKEILARMNSFMFQVQKPDGTTSVIESSDLEDDSKNNRKGKTNQEDK